MVLAQGLSWDQRTVALYSSEGLIGAGRSASKMVPSHNERASASCWWSTPVFITCTASTGQIEFPLDMAARFAQSQWSKREQGKNYTVFPDLASVVTRHHFYKILLVTQVNLCGNYTKVWIPTGQNNWGPSWRLATILTYLNLYPVFYPLEQCFSKHCSVVFLKMLLGIWQKPLSTPALPPPHIYSSTTTNSKHPQSKETWQTTLEDS